MEHLDKKVASRTRSTEATFSDKFSGLQTCYTSELKASYQTCPNSELTPTTNETHASCGSVHWYCNSYAMRYEITAAAPLNKRLQTTRSTPTPTWRKWGRGSSGRLLPAEVESGGGRESKRRCDATCEGRSREVPF